MRSADVTGPFGSYPKSRYYRQSLAKAKESVESFNKEDLEFVVHLGDLIDRNIESYDKVLPILRGLKSKVYYALGNHDYEVAKEDKPTIPSHLDMTSRYYSYSNQDWVFIVLDGNELSFYGTSETDGFEAERDRVYSSLREKKKENIHRWNGGMSKRQMQWLQDKLKSACASNEKALIFSHFPVYPPGPYNLWNDSEIVEILEAHDCVEAYLNGHNHEGNYAAKKGIHYLTLPAVVETNENAYAMIDVFKEELVVRGSGRVQNQKLDLVNVTDTFDVSKDPANDASTSEQSAYEKFLKRSKSELSKLIYLIDKHRQEEFYVVHDGVEYESNWALMQARRYLAENYRKEDASEWIKAHAYRSMYGGHIIYWKTSKANVRPLRDVLLEDLEELNKKLRLE